ncbi:hypothetical protein [Aeoliella sp.]|uniref:hypothetical protein n=1 Tax=Aeoliella sp. TaxID=2795800 RepID=UPI003CCC18DC
MGAARSNQATPDDVRDVVAWWLDRRDGFKFPKEELYYRLQVCSPDLPASEGWPDFREGYEPPEARQAREQERYWQSLVDKWKPTIDGWPESTKRKWWKDIIGDSPELRGDGESIYRRICERLEARQEATV